MLIQDHALLGKITVTALLCRLCYFVHPECLLQYNHKEGLSSPITSVQHPHG